MKHAKCYDLLQMKRNKCYELPQAYRNIAYVSHKQLDVTICPS